MGAPDPRPHLPPGLTRRADRHRGRHIYVTSGFGHVVAVDRKSGKPRWIVDVVKTFDPSPPRFGYSIHPVIIGDLCIIAPTGDDVGLAALNTATGEVVWTPPSPSPTAASSCAAKTRWSASISRRSESTHRPRPAGTRPLPGVHIATGLGGAGLTMSFGLAEAFFARRNASG